VRHHCPRWHAITSSCAAPRQSGPTSVRQRRNCTAPLPKIGAAKADFYPRITLSGSASLQALQFEQLGNWASHQFAVGPSLTLPIFEGGLLKGTLNLRKEQQQEAAVSYQRTVLSAWHEIDNALTAYSAEQQRRSQLEASVADNQRALALAQAQYKGGIGSFLHDRGAEPAVGPAGSCREHHGDFDQPRISLQGIGRRLGGDVSRPQRHALGGRLGADRCAIPILVAARRSPS
jgi:hypothetical protein